MRLLLVENDPGVARFIAKGLRERAYALDVVANGGAALYQASINAYDAVILDIMIPGRDGFEVCRQLRAGGSRVPVLMLTARDAIEDRIRGLDTGADSRSSFANSRPACARSCDAATTFSLPKSRSPIWSSTRRRNASGAAVAPLS